MDGINQIFKLFYQNVNSKNVLDAPTKAEIIDKLSTLGVDNPGYDNTELVNKISKSLTNSVKEYERFFKKNNRKVNIKFLSAINGGYHLLNVFFSDDIKPGVMDSIEIYIPVLFNYLVSTISTVYKFLLNNKISFSSKISNYNRNDNFIVYVYDKKDAIDLIKFCNTNLKDKLGILSPFIYKIGYIGVSKQLNGKSYNSTVATLISDYIEECILSQRKKGYDAIDFQNFVNEKYQEADNYIDKSMYYIVAISIYCILTNKNILNYFEDEITLKFDYEYFHYFDEIVKDKIVYKHDNIIIDEQNNYKVYLKLQALNCLNRICKEEYRIEFNKVKKIGRKFTYKLLEQLDYMLLKSCDYNIKCDYKDQTIYKLIPYLYGYMAYNYKSCNIEETKKLISLIKKTMILKKLEENGKIYYECDGQKIVSSIPIITTLNGSVAIDIIDYNSLLCNITTIKKDKKRSFLNVYINVDINLLIDNKSYDSKRYRYATSQALLNDKRCDRAVENRKKDFSALFLDAKEEINNYL